MRNLYVHAAGSERKIGAGCERPVAWSRDEAAVFCIDVKSVWLVETATGNRKRLFFRDKWTPTDAALSPDGKWLALVFDQGDNHQYAYLAPFEASGLADPSRWTPVMDEIFNLTLNWAPDGTRLYYFSSRDGSRCLWSQRVTELIHGRAAEPPRPVQHFHGYQDYPLNGSAIAVAGNRIAVLLAQHRKNIWQASIRAGAAVNR
jgi:hypothetical protein